MKYWMTDCIYNVIFYFCYDHGYYGAKLRLDAQVPLRRLVDKSSASR